MSNDARAAYMETLYRSGHTLGQIGHAYGLTRERVRQILRKRGVRRDEGGGALKTLLRCEDKKIKRLSKIARRERFAREKFGCTWAEYKVLGPRSDTHSPLGRFIRQRQNAKNRHIAWHLTLMEWWELWQKSGKWTLCGRGAGKYVMARWGDSGPYSMANAKIIEWSENSAEAREMDFIRGRWDRNFCKRGHPRTPENTYIYKFQGRKDWKRCKLCVIESNKKRQVK